MGYQHLQTINSQFQPHDTLERKCVTRPVGRQLQRADGGPSPKQASNDGSRSSRLGTTTRIARHIDPLRRSTRSPSVSTISNGPARTPSKKHPRSNFGIETYRAVQIPSQPRSRSRHKRRLTHISPRAETCTQTSRGKINTSLRSQPSASPDILATQDDQMVLDIDPKLPKRPAQEEIEDRVSIGHPRKRKKSSYRLSGSASEDELNAEGMKARYRGAKTRRVAETDRREPRGDIVPTNFGKTKEQVTLKLSRAVAGTRVYDDGSGKVENLCLTKSAKLEKWVVTTGSDLVEEAWSKEDALDWLVIDESKLQRVKCAAGSCSIVVLERPQVQDLPSKLCIDFPSDADAEIFVRDIPQEKIYPMKPATLQRIMDKAYEEARQYSERPTRIVQEGPLTAERLTSEAVTEKQQVIAHTPTTRSAKGMRLTDKMGREASIFGRASPRLLRNSSSPFQKTEPPKPLYTSSRFFPDTLPPEPSSEAGWSCKNSEWESGWKRSLVFPATGKNRATIDKDDIPRLDEGEFLNDNLVNFYLRYLQTKLETERPELLARVHIFSTFFFDKLRSSKGKPMQDGIKAFTAKIDLFQYDYIVVPINESAHWYLAIICNAKRILHTAEADLGYNESIEVDSAAPISARAPMPGPIKSPSGMLSLPASGSHRLEDRGASPSQQRMPPSPNTVKKPKDESDILRQPKIVTLDSLGNPHAPTCRSLREYLREEARRRKDCGLSIAPTGVTAKEIPLQDNFCDCGLFTLGYVEEFLKDPDEAARRLLLKESVGWKINPQKLRTNIRELIFDLQAKQQAIPKRPLPKCQSPSKEVSGPPVTNDTDMSVELVMTPLKASETSSELSDMKTIASSPVSSPTMAAPLSSSTKQVESLDASMTDRMEPGENISPISSSSLDSEQPFLSAPSSPIAAFSTLEAKSSLEPPKGVAILAERLIIEQSMPSDSQKLIQTLSDSSEPRDEGEQMKGPERALLVESRERFPPSRPQSSTKVKKLKGRSEDSIDGPKRDSAGKRRAVQYGGIDSSIDLT